MKSYDHKKVEQKWQKQWAKDGAYKTDADTSKPKYYVLDMFPYPSGAGLHVGHPKGYIASDIVARKKRMEGHRVLHPMGWDAFGLPAENYAIKTGTPPQQTTDESIATFKSQISNLALSYDWDREIGSHRPDYYRWTQWLFTKFFERGLVYKKKALVNWDPVDQTVLANEQVLPDGTAERSGAVVEKKDLEQWFFKITDYADELADKLDTIDWPESTKINQRNWIGRSEGAELDFYLDFGDETVNARTDDTGKRAHITVFTTRPDTLFGATYLVLAPEHQWVTLALGHKTVLKNNDEVADYVAASRRKTDIDRLSADKEKTGVELKGVVAINPANGEKIPLFVADYVLAHYGTGAIMAVAAHDERDHMFALKYNLPIRQVVEPIFRDSSDSPIKPELPIIKRDAVAVIVRNPADDTYLTISWKNGINMRGLVTGGIDAGENVAEAAMREVREETGYKNLRLVRNMDFAINTLFFHRVKLENRGARFRYVFLELIDTEQEPVSEKEAALHEVVWKTRKELNNHFTVVEGDYTLNFIDNEQFIFVGDGILINSGAYDGLDTEEAKRAITEKFGRVKKTYKMRDWLISRQRYWGTPIPIVYDPEGKPHPVPAEHLPWLLPTDVEYLPKGTSPLGSSKELFERTERVFGKGWRPEIDTMDTFACSSWYFFRFADPHNDQEFTSPEALRDWLPVDLYIGGAEHTVLHLLYARFFTKALRDMGYLNFDEPFLKLRHQGLIMAEDGRKMSKRYGNVINPDDIVESYGADTMRVYEMFMGPFQDSIAWNTQSMIGSRRFLEKVWRLSDKVLPTSVENGVTPYMSNSMNIAIKKIGEDIESFKFNTAISQMMSLLNLMEDKEQNVTVELYEDFLRVLSPFAPHMTEELWHDFLKHDTSIHKEAWPGFDETKLEFDEVTIAIQINGKLRGDFVASKDTDKEALEIMAKETVAERLAGKIIKRVIVVPKKLVNFVVEE